LPAVGDTQPNWLNRTPLAAYNRVLMVKPTKPVMFLVGLDLAIIGHIWQNARKITRLITDEILALMDQDTDVGPKIIPQAARRLEVMPGNGAESCAPAVAAPDGHPDRAIPSDPALFSARTLISHS
jgi:hypothetical protein